MTGHARVAIFRHSQLPILALFATCALVVAKSAFESRAEVAGGRATDVNHFKPKMPPAMPTNSCCVDRHAEGAVEVVHVVAECKTSRVLQLALDLHGPKPTGLRPLAIFLVRAAFIYALLLFTLLYKEEPGGM